MDIDAPSTATNLARQLGAAEGCGCHGMSIFEGRGRKINGRAVVM